MALPLYRVEQKRGEGESLWSPTALCTGDLIKVCRLLFRFKFK